MYEKTTWFKKMTRSETSTFGSCTNSNVHVFHDHITKFDQSCCFTREELLGKKRREIGITDEEEKTVEGGDN